MPGTPDLADRIDDLLPQTQCRRCGYDGCRPYAEAIAAKTNDIDRCPPGGDTLIVALAGCSGARRRRRSTRRGGYPGLAYRPHRRAHVHRLHAMHPGMSRRRDRRRTEADAWRARVALQRLRALRSALPVDCIEMVPAGREWTHPDAVAARARFEQRRNRLAMASPVSAHTAEARKRKAAVAAALARARARRRAVEYST